MVQLSHSGRTIKDFTLKKYGSGPDSYYKLTIFKFGLPKKSESKNSYEYDSKLDSSLSRTRSMIFEYSMCNKWDYFCTLTLDKNKMNRYDLPEFISSLSHFIRNNKARKGSNIKYCLIPEEHKDGAYHMHGLLTGINFDELKQFTLDDPIPIRIKNLIRQGKVIYNWLPYSEKFGWVTLEKVRNKQAVSRYITKYIKKEVGNTVKEKNKKSYYCSKGLKKAKTIKKETLPLALEAHLQIDYENDYIAISEFNEDFFQSLQPYFNVSKQLSKLAIKQLSNKTIKQLSNKKIKQSTWQSNITKC